MRTIALLTLLAALSLTAACSSRVVYVEKSPRKAKTVESKGVSTAASLGIPPGHLPRPGYCRVWFPGRPPGHQPKPGPCSALRHQVPAGAWLVYRPTQDKKHVRVTVFDAERTDTVLSVRLYDANTGVFVRYLDS